MTEQTNQSEIDRLVEQPETDVLWHERRGNETIANDCRQAASELRRLYAENESLREQYTAIDITCENLEAVNAELLEVLNQLSAEFEKVFSIYYYSEPWAHNQNISLIKAKAAIAKHLTGESK